jgi:hypothetical protein
MKHLPIHWAIRESSPKERVLELIEVNRSTIHLSDELNNTAFDNALVCGADLSVLYELLKASLPVNPETKEAIDATVHEYAWARIIQHDRNADIVHRIMTEFPHITNELASSVDDEGAG